MIVVRIDYLKILKMYFADQMTARSICDKEKYPDTTVRSFIGRFLASRLQWPLAQGMTNQDIRKILYDDPEGVKVIYDYSNPEEQRSTANSNKKRQAYDKLPKLPEIEPEGDDEEDFTLRDVEKSYGESFVENDQVSRDENSKSTLCWDCGNATGGCAWSDFLVPVPGWRAVERHYKESMSYKVITCPCFERDSYNYGSVRMPKKTPETKSDVPNECAQTGT